MADFWQIAALSLTMLLAIFAGGWALLQRHFSLGEKLQSTVQDHTMEAIARLEKVFEKLAAKVDEIEKRLDHHVDAIRDRITNLNSQAQAYAEEVRKTRDEMGAISRGMDDKIARFAKQLETVPVGEGAYRITAKKPR